MTTDICEVKSKDFHDILTPVFFEKDRLKMEEKSILHEGFYIEMLQIMIEAIKTR